MQLQPVLTDKEIKEFQDSMVAVFHTVFKYFDLGITHTNRRKKVAVIWSDIDDDDIKILVQETMSAAKKSRIVATGVRQLSKAHRLLRIGIITGPRFMQTVQHYAQNGGFILPWTPGEVEEDETTNQ